MLPISSMFHFFKTSANERPPHAVVMPTVVLTVKLSDSGLEDKLDLPSELESSVLMVGIVIFPKSSFYER